MNIYKYNLNAITISTKYKLLNFNNSTISFEDIDIIDEEHKTPALLFCIRTHEELGKSIIQKKINIINGILLLISSNIGIHKNIKLGEIDETINIDELGEKKIIESEDLLSKIYNNIIGNIELEEIFMLLGNDVSFAGLYKITDILPKLGIKENEDIKLVKRIANSSIIGLESRHGLSKHLPPKKFLNKDDALIIICESIIEILKRDYNISGITLIQKSWGIA